MGKNHTQIVSDILMHISMNSAKYFDDFYIGIAKNPEERLFEQHLVSKTNHCWIYQEASSEDEARKAEKTLLDIGMKGGPGGGDKETRFVYCYRITTETKE